MTVYNTPSQKIKKKIKNNRTVDEGLKGDCRDHMQVLANALIPSLSATLFAVSGIELFVVAFVASLSEALADTVASSMGAFSKKTFDLFKWKKCENGISGGVSIIGTVSALVASFILPLVALAFGAFDPLLVCITAASAFLGTIVDTALGSLLQVKYTCAVCGKLTEKHIHCDKPTKHHSGLKYIDNDVVNLLSGIASALISVFLCFLVMRSFI